MEPTNTPAVKDEGKDQTDDPKISFDFLEDTILSGPTCLIHRNPNED